MDVRALIVSSTILVISFIDIILGHKIRSWLFAPVTSQVERQSMRHGKSMELLGIPFRCCVRYRTRCVAQPDGVKVTRSSPELRILRYVEFQSLPNEKVRLRSRKRASWRLSRRLLSVLREFAP